MESFNNIAWLIFGKNNPHKIRAFKDLFTSEVKQVNIYPQGTTTTYLNNKIPGICRLDENDNKLIIEMLGYTKAKSNQYSFIKHEATHEFCHSFADLLPMASAKYPNGIIKNGIKCQNHMGMIKETDFFIF